MADGTQTSPEITRREFLKLAGTLGIAGTLGYILFGPKIIDWLQNIKEKEPISNSHVVMVDFAPEKPSELLDQQHFPNNEALAKKLLGQDYKTVGQIDTEFGFGALEADDRSLNVLKKYPKLFILFDYMKNFVSNHGLVTATAMKTGWDKLGVTGKKPTIEPLQETVNSDDGSLMEPDSFGNFGVRIHLSAESLIGVLEKIIKPSGKKAINLSLQVGGMEFWKSPIAWNELKQNKPLLECNRGQNGLCVITTLKNESHFGFDSDEYIDKKGNKLPLLTEAEAKLEFDKKMREYEQTNEYQDPGTRRIGAYAKDRQQNVLGLNKIAEAFTESVVVAAAGNNKDDFRDEVKNLNERVITVGEWDQERNKPDLISTSYGAHLYVPNYTYEIGHGSSCSTGFVSALVDYLIDKNIPANEIRSVILTQYCSETTYIDPDGKTEITYVLDPAKFHQYNNP